MDLRIECLEKKYQPSSLSGVQFGSRAIQFLGENHGAKYFCMERSNFCMEQSVFHYGANWLLTIVPTYNSIQCNTVAFFATKFAIGFHTLQSGFFYGTKAGRFNSAFD